MKKRILSIALVLCMVLALMPTVLAAGGTSSSDSGTSTYVAAIGEKQYGTLAEAVQAVTADTTTESSEVPVIELLADATVDSQLDITKAVTLKGNGKTIKASGSNAWSTDNSSKYMICVKAANVTVQDVTLEGAYGENKATAGIQFYCVDGGKLDNVTVKNVTQLGINVNASTVTATGKITIEDAGWGNSINVGWGSSITDRNSCSLDASTADLSGVASLYSDKDDISHAGNNSISITAPSDWGIVDTYVAADGEKAASGVKGYAPAVAQVGETKYAFLAEAISKATDGATVTLLDDISLNSSTTINKSLTIEGNGHTISGNNIDANYPDGTIGFDVAGGTVTFNNMTLTGFDKNESYGSVIRINPNCDTAKVIANKVKINLFSRNAFTFKAGSFEINDCEIDCAPRAARTQVLTKGFQIGFSTSKVSGTINNTKIINSESNYDRWSSYAIEIYNNSDVSINNCEISQAKNGILVDNYWAGSTSYPNLSGDVVVGVNNTNVTAANNALVIYSREGQTVNASATINSGKYTGDTYIWNYTIDDIINSNANNIISITGGTFSTDPSAYVKNNGEDYIVRKDSDTSYTVVAKENLTSGVYMSDPSGSVASGYVVSGSGPYTVSVYIPTTTTTTTTNDDGSKTTTTTNKSTGTTTETTTSQPVTDEAGNTTQTTTETVTKKDGSTTETVTETVKAADGSTTETVTETATNKDGATTSTTETVTTTDTTGTTATKVTETDATGDTSTTVTATVSDKAVEEAAQEETSVTLPVEVTAAESKDATAITVQVPASVDAENTVKVEIPVENLTTGTVAVVVNADGTEEIVKTSTLGEDGVVLTLEGDATVKIVDNSKIFEDVHPVDHWAEDAVTYVAAREMFEGTGNNNFSPDEDLNRAMLMTVLARYDGQDTTGGETWYEQGMNWAMQTGVSDGSDPEVSITREQMVTMLWRYAGKPESNHALDFNDAHDINDWAETAMRWAVSTGIINGVGNNVLDPQGPATRAQVATVMMRFCEKINK